MPVELESKENILESSNKVLSIYSKDEILKLPENNGTFLFKRDGWFNEQVGKGRLLYANTQKIKRWYQTSSESNPLRADKNALFGSSVKTEDDLVKARSDSGNILYKNQKETDVVLQNHSFRQVTCAY